MISKRCQICSYPQRTNNIEPKTAVLLPRSAISSSKLASPYNFNRQTEQSQLKQLSMLATFPKPYP